MKENNFLFVKGISGLGNRMLSALTGVLYARLTGRRLIVDWSDHYYSNDGSNAFHRFFLCPWYGPDDGIPNTDSVIPGIWRGRLYASAWYMREHYGDINDSRTWQKFSIDLKRLDYQKMW